VGFWFAYIVTRPLGASFADWLAWPPSVGGLGLGHGMVSLVSAVIIIGLVGYMAATGKDVMVRNAGPRPSARSSGPASSGPPARPGPPGRPGGGLRPGPYDRPVQSGRHRRPD
jgi:hypothetical protein